MRIAVCSEDPPSASSRAIISCLQKRDCQVDVIEEPSEDGDYDAALICARSRPRSKSVPLYWQAALALEDANVSLLNSSQSHLNAYDKLASHNLFASRGLRPPLTWSMTAPVNKLFFPLVCKPVASSRGQGVILVDDFQQALDHQNFIGQPCLLQEPIDQANCLRVIVSKSGVISSYRKVDKRDHFVVSVSSGAERVDIDDLPGLNQLACEMLASVGGNLMACDILEDNKGRLWPLEINATFAFNTEDQHLVEQISDHLLQIVS